jgi:ATP-dependent RNA helicase DeaD
MTTVLADIFSSVIMAEWVPYRLGSTAIWRGVLHEGVQQMRGLPHCGGGGGGVADRPQPLKSTRNRAAMSFPPTHPALARAIAARGYDEPTPVQAAVLAADAAGRDMLVSAQTGSGKTVAYGLAFADTLLGEADQLPRAGAPLALIVAPTRELAIQVHGELSWLYAAAGARVVSCVGGMDPRRERQELAAGCHIVVGTPGRLRDHLERGQLDIADLRVVVLDEADEMLDLGFRDELQFILDATPAQRRTLLFSATIAREIANLARQYQRDALRIDTVSRDTPHGDIAYRAIRVAPGEIEHALVNVLRFYETRGTLVFCATRDAVRHMHARLVERGFSAVALSGELSQAERSSALQALRDGRARVCIATDVAARGLDLPDLDLVVHVDIPTNKAMLLHRSGRTGRAGRKGTCLLLVPYPKRRRAEMLLGSAHIAAEWGEPPTGDEIRARDQLRLLTDPVLTEPATEDDIALGRTLLASRPAEEVAAALIRLYRSRMPAPEDLFDGRTVAPEPQGYKAAAREEKPDPGEMVWFRLGIGRRQNADPKWVLPLICRLGHVTKKDIGRIRIFDRETKFEITEETATRFAAAVAASGETEMAITPADPVQSGRHAPGGPPRAHRAMAHGPKAHGHKAHGHKAQGHRGPPARQGAS